MDVVILFVVSDYSDINLKSRRKATGQDPHADRNANRTQDGNDSVILPHRYGCTWVHRVVFDGIQDVMGDFKKPEAASLQVIGPRKKDRHMFLRSTTMVVTT